MIFARHSDRVLLAGCRAEFCRENFGAYMHCTAICGRCVQEMPGMCKSFVKRRKDL